MDQPEEALVGGRFSAPVRRGNVVERAAGPWTPNVHALLRHLAERGFDRAPTVLGMSDDGTRERLGYLEGTPGLYPLSAEHRSEEALVSVAETARAIHDAAADFVPPEPDAWQRLTAAPTRIDCYGHHDLGPWNLLFDGPRVVGVLDWDASGPSNRVWDLCYAAHRLVPLSGPRIARPFGWDDEPDRARRLRLFAASYGHGIEPAELLDVAAIRLATLAAHIEREIRLGNPAYDVHREERHADAYRADLEFILTHRAELLSDPA